MAKQIIDGRIKMKTDTTENWGKARNFIPLKGEIIVYSDYETKVLDGKQVNIPNFKIGDGMAYGIDLPFVGDELRLELNAHINDSNLHISDMEREFWNHKVRCYYGTDPDPDAKFVHEDTLIFTIN